MQVHFSNLFGAPHAATLLSRYREAVMDTTTPQTRDWLALAEMLGLRFAERATALDETDAFAAENYAELKRHRIFSAGVPTEFGGGGASYRELAGFLRVLARHCGSTALALSMHTHTVARSVWTWKHMDAPVAPLLQRIAAEQMVLITTGGNDWLESLGTAEPAPGGFRVNARKPFASGMPAGDAFMTSAVYDDPDAGATVLHFSVPVRADGVRAASNWRTLGMRATGSDDVLFENVFVPDAAVAARRPKGVWHPSVHLAAMIAFPLVYAVYLGVTEAARDIALGLVPTAKRGDPLIQLSAGEMENQLTAARLAVERMIELGADATPGEAVTNAVFSARTLAAEAALRCVDRAMELAGGKGFYRIAGLERRLRDIQAARYHPMRAKEQQLLAGRIALGVPIDG
jgi:alkylation response protein AidB-like acyl-CoA dehydrogenase